MKPNEGRSRVLIEDVKPQIDGGRYAVKRIAGDRVTVSAVIYCDGHDHVAARLLYRRDDERAWRYTPFSDQGNDVWEAHFSADTIGGWTFTVEAWVDHFSTYIHDLHKRIEAQERTSGAMPLSGGPEQNEGVNAVDQNTVTVQELQGEKKASSVVASRPESDVALALRTGGILLDQASARARDQDAKLLKGNASTLRYLAERNSPFYDFPLSDDCIKLALEYPDRTFATTYEKVLPLWVDRERARFSAWYEFFPRSAGKPGVHGTFRDVIAHLPMVAKMGFDVVYLPPIHPIGTAYRKGRNNAVTAEPGDVGSPWAIGNMDGGHKAILKDLGSFEDFAAMVNAAHDLGMELALDIAFQCAPEHPWVKEHPDWFKMRPDGSIQYAENPPKKYQDIYPLNFESADWRTLWKELLSVFLLWIDRGVTVFRVDNPHTKALPFWEWCIAEVRKTHPETIFLAEAFTRPHVMYGLAKGGYTQSYTYFSWRTEKNELTRYMTEITTEPVSEYFRANLWPNTPDILPEFLQKGGRAGFAQRAILAATMGASYGVYGPAFELCDDVPVKPGSEEYLNSEKYEIKTWHQDDPNSLAPLLTALNGIRRGHTALQSDKTLLFHGISNDQMIAYSKRDGDDVLLMVVNLDPHNVQQGWTDLRLTELNLPIAAVYDALDLLTGELYEWQGSNNYVSLNPETMPAHILWLRPRQHAGNLAGESMEA